MNLYRNMATLLAISVAVATETTGSTYRIEANNEDGVKDHEQDYQVYFSATQSGGASSPTSQIVVQTSPDNSTWYDLAESTELSTAGSKAETKDVSGAPILKYIRAVTVLGGGTNPNHTCEVRLVSNGAFRARLVS